MQKYTILKYIFYIITIYKYIFINTVQQYIGKYILFGTQALCKVCVLKARRRRDAKILVTDADGVANMCLQMHRYYYLSVYYY